jgi:lysophospholipase L1-like esterase
VIMNEMVDTYNAAISRVVAREGVELVNLRGGDFLIGQHPEWVSADGFHPNTQGYEVIAGFFEKAYKSRSKAA